MKILKDNKFPVIKNLEQHFKDMKPSLHTVDYSNSKSSQTVLHNIMNKRASNIYQLIF